MPFVLLDNGVTPIVPDVDTKKVSLGVHSGVPARPWGRPLMRWMLPALVGHENRTGPRARNRKPPGCYKL
jgi:hypothetical protein